MFIDFHQLLYVALPILILTTLVQFWLKAVVAKWSERQNSQGISGAEAAVIILRQAGIRDVKVEETEGFLSDHYSPSEKVVRLSPEIYHGRTITAVGVAAHEVGHAMQHAFHYAPLVVRNLAVPLASIGSNMGYIVMIMGVMFNSMGMAMLGLILVGGVAVFQLINLPVEFDASRRALKLLPSLGILSQEENAGARSVLTAAAMTYVAATVAAIWTVIYWAIRLGLIGGRRD